MNKPIKYFPAIFVVTLIAGAAVFWVIRNNQQKAEQQERELLKRSRTNYEAVIEGIKSSAEMFYSHVVLDDRVFEIMDNAEKTLGEDRNKLRKELYQLLLNDYQKIVKNGFRQLHFHLPDGISFLRFHRPSKYGDNLKPYRYSVARTNQTLKPTFGFEEGRVHNGYRFVYPLVNDGEHVGSVEVSVSYLAIIKALYEIEQSKTGFLLDADVVEDKLFADEKQNYVSSELIDGYVWDKAIIEDSIGKYNYDILKKLISVKPDQFIESLKNNFVTLNNIELEDKNYALVVYPVPNIQGAQVGNVLMAYPNNYVLTLKGELTIRLGIVLALYLFLLFAFIAIIRRDRRLLSTSIKLKKSQANLAETDEVKAKLFEIITHDMRNHFSAVNGFADLLERKFAGKDPQLDKLLNGLNDSIHLTNSLMGNLFVWSRIQIGKVEFKPEMFEASKWFHKEIDRFGSIIARKGLTVTDKTKGPVYIYGDIDMMAYIVNNVVHNAIKYSERGGAIEVKLTDNTKKTSIEVKDQGKGMSAFEIDTILKKENWTGSRTRQDIGLGLLVTRKLIDYHKGEFTIESETDIGTKVIITLPKK